MNNSDIALFIEEILCSLCKQHLLIAKKADDLKIDHRHLSDSKKFLIKLTGLFLFHSHLYTNCISCEKVYSKAINWIAYSLARLALTSITTG